MKYKVSIYDDNFIPLTEHGITVLINDMKYTIREDNGGLEICKFVDRNYSPIVIRQLLRGCIDII
jgi:hypothetical protein